MRVLLAPRAPAQISTSIFDALQAEAPAAQTCYDDARAAAALVKAAEKGALGRRELAAKSPKRNGVTWSQPFGAQLAQLRARWALWGGAAAPLHLATATLLPSMASGGGISRRCCARASRPSTSRMTSTPPCGQRGRPPPAASRQRAAAC